MVTGSMDGGFVITNYSTSYPTTPDYPTYPNTPDYPDDPNGPYTPETFEIPDVDVPLTDIPDEETPLTDIFDDEVPLDALPSTGDESNTAAMLAIMLVSAAGIAVLAAILVIDRRRSRREDADK